MLNTFIQGKNLLMKLFESLLLTLSNIQLTIDCKIFRYGLSLEDATAVVELARKVQVMTSIPIISICIKKYIKNSRLFLNGYL